MWVKFSSVCSVHSVCLRHICQRPFAPHHALARLSVLRGIFSFCTLKDMQNRYLLPLASVAILSGIIGLWTFSRAGSEEIIACVSPSGLMRYLANGECRRGETELSWNIQGPQGEKGETGAPGEQGPTGAAGADGTSPHLFDANGQDLGILVEGFGPGFATFDRSTDAFFTFQNDNSRLPEPIAVFIPLGIDALYFEHLDCEGAPFISIQGHLRVMRVGPSLTSRFPEYWIYDVSGGRRELAYLSHSVADARQCINTSGVLTDAILLKEVALPFTEPLAWPLTVRTGNE